MVRIRTLGLVLAAVFALSAVAAAAASAHEFEFSTTGELKGKQTGNQVFVTPDGTITCTENSLKGIFNELNFKRIILKDEYAKCTSSLGTITTSATEYEFLAEKELKILKEMTIKAKVAGLECVITIPAQGPLKTVEYANVGSHIEAKAKITKLKSSATGAACTKYTNNETGELSGNNTVELVGGTMDWK
jgi:hypothetical protein